MKSTRNLSPSSYNYLIKILKEIFLKPGNMCQKLGIIESEIMQNIVLFYSDKRIPECQKSELLEVLTCSRYFFIFNYVVDYVNLKL